MIRHRGWLTEGCLDSDSIDHQYSRTLTSLASTPRPLTPLSFQVLVALADCPRHGYGILKEIEERTGEPFASSTGTLYLALQRLEEEGAIEPTTAPASGDARRRYYRLTAAGREAAASEAARLTRLLAVARDKRLFGEPEAATE